MRPFHPVLGLAFGLLPLCAAEPTYGIGLSVKQNEQKIYAPLQLSPSLRLEGSLAFDHRTRNFSGTDASDSTTQVGVGIFHVRPLSEAFQLYAGPRLTYSHSAMKMGGTEISTSKAFGITPLLGLEYRLNRNLTLSGEAGVNWASTDSKYPTSETNLYLSSTGKQWSTHTALTLRYWF